MIEQWSLASKRWERGKVDMASKGLRDEQIDVWCEWFTKEFLPARPRMWRSLDTFDFSNNFITDLGMRGLLQTLSEQNITTRSLKLFQNRLSSAGPISRWLDASDGKLEELHLSDNNFDAAEVCSIVESAVLNDVYPIGGKRPLWLRVDGKLSYNPSELERLLRDRLAELGRPFDRYVHVLLGSEKACKPYKCCRSPTPSVHAPYLFSHHAKQAPAMLHKTQEHAINYPRIIEGDGFKTLDMSRRGVRDGDLPSIFRWIKRELPRRTDGIITLKEVNVANNHLTVNGLTRLIRFLIESRISLSILRMKGNASELGDDIDFTLVAGRELLKDSKRCPALTSGCTCGLCCQKLVSRDYLHTQWKQHFNITELKVNMSNRGVDDVTMESWCAWFSDFVALVRLRNVVLKDLDFSVNHLTVLGVAKLLETLRRLGIKTACLRLYANQICLNYGGPIEEFVEWSCGELAELHVSRNKLEENAIIDIVVKVLTLTDALGSPTYPLRGSQPLWLVASQNNYASQSLEQNLRSALHRLHISLDEEVCNVTHALRCIPQACRNTKMRKVPAIHGKYLFPHWERTTVDANEDLSPSHKMVTVNTQKKELQKALHALALQRDQWQQWQPHAEPVDRAPRQQAQAQPTKIPQACKGFQRTGAMLSLALAPSTNTNCFVSPTLFRRANMQESYVSAAELRCGDLLLGSCQGGVRVARIIHHQKTLRNMVRLQAEHSDAAFIVTSDHRVQVDCDGKCLAAGKIHQLWKDGKEPVVSDGKSLHKVVDAKYKKEKVAVIEVYFESDEAAYIWLRPRRWRSKSADCPRIVVFGESPHLVPGVAYDCEEQEKRYNIATRYNGVFIDSFAGSAERSAFRCHSAPPRYRSFDFYQ